MSDQQKVCQLATIVWQEQPSQIDMAFDRVSPSQIYNSITPHKTFVMTFSMRHCAPHKTPDKYLFLRDFAFIKQLLKKKYWMRKMLVNKEKSGFTV